MKRLKIGLNGFGRIGRAFTRIAMERDSFDVVAVNTRRTKPDMMAYLLRYDSVYRRYHKEVSHNDSSIRVGEKTIRAVQYPNPEEIPWGEYGVDVVIDATGAFTKKEDLQKHRRDSVQKVILTAPAKDGETAHVVLGVNDDTFDWGGESIISNASCTTNCAAPMFKVLHESFGVVAGFLTTAHAYTSTQPLLDDAGKSPDRSRAAAINAVPTSTGAAKAVAKVIPELSGKLDGMAIRIPVPTGSFTDVSVITSRTVTIEEVNEAFKQAADGRMHTILGYATEVLASSDYIGDPHSCTFDSNYTNVIEGTLVKVYGWYDNEWGYSTRLVDLVERCAKEM